MMLCKSEKSLYKEEEIVKKAVESGLSAKMLSVDEIKSIEPNINIKTIGAAYFGSDHHTTPGEMISELKKFIVDNGVNCLKNTEIENFEIDGDKIKSVQISGKSVRFDEYVLSTGTWTSKICKKLGIDLLLQAGKGYSINHHKQTGITCPAILVEAKCAVTPMNGFSRFSGTMEISSINNKLRMNRVNAIADSVESFTINQNSSIRQRKCWFGFRPISADGLPYIGRTKKLKNVLIATGHGMMGWSMSTGTGKIISELISEKNTSINIDRFNPNRKF